MANKSDEGVAPKGIHQKVAAIMAEFPTLQKNGVGPATQGSYAFLSVDDVLAAARPLLVKYKVIVVPAEVKTVEYHHNTAAVKEDGRTPRENTQVTAVRVYRLIDTEDGSFLEYEIPAEGIDSQDKATRKMATSAQKVLYIEAFQLITGEPDPDGQDGGADSQNAAPTPTSSTLQRAQAPRPPAKGVNPAVEALRKDIRETYVTPASGEGVITTTGLNELVAKVRESSAVDADDLVAVLTEVKARLERGEV